MTTHRNLTLASLIATVSLSALTVTGAFAQTPAGCAGDSRHQRAGSAHSERAERFACV